MNNDPSNSELDFIAEPLTPRQRPAAQAVRALHTLVTQLEAQHAALLARPVHPKQPTRETAARARVLAASQQQLDEARRRYEDACATLRSLN